MFTEITVVGVALDALERLSARFEREGAEIAEAVMRAGGGASRPRSKGAACGPEYVVVSVNSVARARDALALEDPRLAAALEEFQQALVEAGAPAVVLPCPKAPRVPGGARRRALLQPAFTQAATRVAPLRCPAGNATTRPSGWGEDEAEFYRILDERAEWVAPRVERVVRLLSRVAVAFGFEDARSALVDRSIDGLFVQRAWAGFVTGAGYEVVRQRADCASALDYGVVAAVADGVVQSLRAGGRVSREAALVCMFKGLREGLEGAAFVIGGRDGEVTDAELERVVADCVRAVLADERESVECARLGLPNPCNPDLTAALRAVFGAG